jgi:hypothetical protein
MSSKNIFSLVTGVCFSWHPAPVRCCDTVSVALFASPRIAGFHFRSFGLAQRRRQAVRWHRGQPWWPTMGSIGGSRLTRGAMAMLGCPREHTVAHETFAYPAQDTCPRTRARSCFDLQTPALQPSSAAWCLRAYAACGFRCSASKVAPFFHRMRAIAAILRAPASAAPSPAACRGRSHFIELAERAFPWRWPPSPPP